MGIGIGTGRGGARPGAGRPRKHPLRVAPEARVVAEADPRVLEALAGIHTLLSWRSQNQSERAPPSAVRAIFG